MDWKRAIRLLFWAVIGCMPTMVAVNHFGSDPLRLTLLSVILLWVIGLYRIESKMDELLHTDRLKAKTLVRIQLALKELLEDKDE